MMNADNLVIVAEKVDELRGSLEEWKELFAKLGRSLKMSL